MLKSFIFSLLLLTANAGFGQTIYPFQDIKLEKTEDYKDAEPFALMAAKYIIQTPFKKDDANRKHAIQFLTNWISGTKEYIFRISGMAKDLRDDADLFALFIAAMAKFSIENKSASANGRLVDIASSKMVLEYCDNPLNNFSLKKKMRKKLEFN